MSQSKWTGPSIDLRHGPIRVSDNARFLQHADGAPFFWLGDTVWEIFHRATREEAELLLEKRRTQGYTVIQSVALAEFNGLRTPNAYGEYALIDLDPTRPNEAYFKHVDWVIDKAAEKGLVIGLLPTWGDKVVRSAWGEGPIVFNEDNARVYGRWLGQRYGARTNVVWILGGDRPAIWDGKDDYRPIWRAMAAGIDEGTGGNAFMTFHPCGGAENRTSRHLHNEAWLDANMMQSSHGAGHDVPVWQWIEEDYALQPTKPTFDGEPNYEDHPINPWPSWDPANGYYNAHDVRKQLYRSVFAGACGVTYGHHSVWQFYEAGKREPVNHPYCTWLEAIDRPAANQVIHLRRLMESRPYFSRVPDQSMLAFDPGQRGNHVRATRDAQRRYAFVYVPNTQTVDIAMDAIAGETANVWWYNPRDGSATSLGAFATTGTRFFTTPVDGPDWVLVLDDASQGYPVGV